MFLTFHLKPRVPLFGRMVGDRMDYSPVGMIARRVLARERDRTPDVLLMASGSEVEQVLGAQAELAKDGIAARVISMPCMETFLKQDDEYRESVMPNAIRARVAMEAGATMPWYRFTGLDGAVIGLVHYGASAPAAILFKEYGFTVENVVAAVKEVL